MKYHFRERARHGLRMIKATADGGLGARAANAGTEFHVVWAVAHVLRLLVPGGDLAAVAVEGIGDDDPTREQDTADSWQGVDLALFFGGETISTAKRIEIEQLKYSTAAPDRPWSVARLCQARDKAGTNSVIARLAQAYGAAVRSGLASTSVRLKLVSNQPVHPDVLSAVTAIRDGATGGADAVRLMDATGLPQPEAEIFFTRLDLSQCGGPSRFDVHARVVRAIEEVSTPNSRQVRNELWNLVRSRMLPGEFGAITKEAVIGAMLFGSAMALLPCPPALSRPAQIVPRAVSREIAGAVMRHRRVLVHGQGGCGKTTTLFELETLLPSGSELLVFDCYGGGTYMDSDAQRHLPKDAFLHLCNELSARVSTPLLVPPPANVDYPREFADRLRKASRVVAARDPDALLVVVVDAADNSVTAASSHVPPEASFVHAFASLGELPGNVRLVVSARSGRREALRLGSAFQFVEVPPFTEAELGGLCALEGRSPSPAWLTDAYQLSGGNPRVLAYAFKYADETGRDALEYLRPTGKTLDGVFEERIREALSKSGDEAAFDRLSAALSALQRPIAVPLLARVAGLTEPALRDVLSDMAPGLLERGGAVMFSDEDFEHFIDERARPHVPAALQVVADELFRDHEVNAYCAEHVATALLAAGRGAALLKLAHDVPEPKAIRDPVRRREVQLQRLKLAMRVARQAGDTVKSITVILRGARALRTDSAVRKMLNENTDLAARFAASSLKRNVLFDRDSVSLHGAALAQLMLAAAARGDGTEARATRRQLEEWLQRCFEHNRTCKPNRRWKLGMPEVVAIGEAAFLTDGVDAGVASLARWKPKPLALAAVVKTAQRLLSSGHAVEVESAIARVPSTSIWTVLVRAVLAQAGRQVDTAAMDLHLDRWVTRGWLKPTAARWRAGSEAAASEVVWPLLLRAAETVVAVSGMQPGARRVLETLGGAASRSVGEFVESRTDAIDCALRCFALLQAVAGQPATAEAFLAADENLAPLAEGTSHADRERFHKEKKRREEVLGFVRGLLPFYTARASLLLDGGRRSQSLEDMVAALDSYARSDYQARNDYDRQEMRKRLHQTAAESLFVRDDVALAIVLHGVVDPEGSFLAARELSALTSLTVRPAAREHVLSIALKRAQKIRDAREPATDRSSQLVSLARLVMEISGAEAAALFTMALECLQDVDYDVTHELGMVGPFAKRAVACAGDANQRRAIASDLVDVTARTWSYLGEGEGIPWETIVGALAHLDVPVALAALARWSDEGIVSLPRHLGMVLKAAVAAESMSTALATALSYLTGTLERALLESILDAVNRRGAGDYTEVLEELARIAVLNVDGKRHLEQVRLVGRAAAGRGTRWLTQAAEIAAFAAKELDDPEVTEAQANAPVTSFRDRSVRLALASSGANPFTTLEEIRDALQEHAGREAEKGAVERYYEDDVFEAMRGVVRLADRRKHLEALEQLQLRNRYAVPDAIVQAVIAWAPESPAVRGWCSERLAGALVQRLPWLVGHLAPEFGQESKLLAAAGLQDVVLVSSILEGLELHAAACAPETIYRALGVVAGLVRAEEAAAVLSYHLSERAADVDLGYVRMDLHDIPSGVPAAASRLLNACLGDLELSVRWQAAHALRACARMKVPDVVDGVFRLWPARQESSFRAPGTPFYWCAARLWQMLAAARIARETPSAVAAHRQFFLDVLTDAGFPHVLVRDYAREALVALRERGGARFTASEELLIASTNRAKVPFAKAAKRTEGNFGRFGSQDGFRFHFDSTDTLPYWYERALRLFAHVSSTTFLELAERWIIDRWGANPNTWKWVDEPRQPRFKRERLSSSHRHGSLPSVERYSTHLEWHAMFCVVGELLEREPLLKIKPGEYDSFEYFLARHQLTEGPFWLSDYRQAKPLEQFLWDESTDDSSSDEDWLSDVNEERMLAYLCRPGIKVLPVSARESGARGQRRWGIDVSSALVQPATAGALLRALQGVGSSWDYAVPGSAHTEDINVPPFVLKAWIVNQNKDVELDQDDPMRREVGYRQAEPGNRVCAWLGMPARCDDELRWTSTDSRSAFAYQAWSDERIEGDRRYGAEGCSGYRLVLDKEGLRRVLHHSKMDLLVEITFTRRTKEHSIGDDDQEEPSEAEFDFLVVLRRDGSIESAGGPVGVWCTSG